MGAKLPPLPAIGPICYASAMDILLYKDAPEVGRHLPGVRDVALWSTDQMRAYATLHASNLAAEIKWLEKLRTELRLIAEQDPVELMLDPLWAKRIASAALSTR